MPLETRLGAGRCRTGFWVALLIACTFAIGINVVNSFNFACVCVCVVFQGGVIKCLHNFDEMYFLIPKKSISVNILHRVFTIFGYVFMIYSKTSCVKDCCYRLSSLRGLARVNHQAHRRHSAHISEKQINHPAFCPDSNLFPRASADRCSSLCADPLGLL